MAARVSFLSHCDICTKMNARVCFSLHCDVYAMSHALCRCIVTFALQGGEDRVSSFWYRDECAV